MISQQKARQEQLKVQMKSKETDMRYNTMEERRCNTHLNKLRDDISKIMLVSKTAFMYSCYSSHAKKLLDHGE